MKTSIYDLSQSLGIGYTGPADRLVSIPLTDSRSLLYPDETIFFALSTTTGDGHDYLRELYRRGVRSFVVSRECNLPDDASVLKVNSGMSVLDALQLSAAHIRKSVSCPIIAITGSRGKTIIKETLARAFSSDAHPVVTSPRSWNSQIGVPMSIWRLQPDTALAIFEAGISKPGEMMRLANIIAPTIGIFTGLTDEHSDGFNSLEQKCREKALLFNSSQTIIQYCDREYSSGISDDTIESILSDVNPHARIIRVNNVPDLITTVNQLTGAKYKLPTSDTISTRIDITEGDDRRLIAYDHFSSDLGAIETALDRFARRLAGQRLVAILGDIECRGLKHDNAYKLLEKLLLARGVDEVIGIGPQISVKLPYLSNAFSHRSYSSVEQFLNDIDHSEFSDTAVLINGQGFEPIKAALEATRHATCLEVNLDSLTNNFNHYKSLVSKSTNIIAMVKADAYGAGAIEVAKTLQNQGAAYLAVAVVEEGIALRQAGISMPIMVLNPITTDIRAILRYNLEPTIFSLDELINISSFIARNSSTLHPIHIKLDTGMHRFGFSEKQLPALIQQLNTTPGVKVASIFSHLATADCLDMDDYTRFQLDNFERMSSCIISSLPYSVKRHILNTAGISRFPDHQYDMVRLGIGLYGIDPIGNTNPALSTSDKNAETKIPDTPLKQVSSLITSISALQHRFPGDTVGYGRRGVIKHQAVIATIPIGYADGLNRHLGNGNALMMVNGHLCPTIGNICMDISMIDVTDVPGVEVGDRVEIFGPNIPVTTLSNTLETIPYEVLTSVAPRVKRIYFRE